MNNERQTVRESLTQTTESALFSQRTLCTYVALLHGAYAVLSLEKITGAEANLESSTHPNLSGVFLALLVLSLLCIEVQASEVAPEFSASTELNVVLGRLARVTGLQDVDLGQWSEGDLTADQNFCIGLFASRNYRIRASGSGTPTDTSAFVLRDGSNYLPYEVYFNDATGINGRQRLTANQSLTDQGNSRGLVYFFNLYGCFFANANLSLVIPEANLETAAAGNYSGTLTLTLIPE